MSQGTREMRVAHAQSCRWRGCLRGRRGAGLICTRTWLAQQALNLLRAVATPRSVGRTAVCVTVVHRAGAP